MGEEKKENEQKGIQWHPAFVSAMNLELAQDRWGLVFEREYNLNTKPLEIDLLIIKKEKDVRIHNKSGISSRNTMYWNIKRLGTIWMWIYIIRQLPMDACIKHMRRQWTG